MTAAIALQLLLSPAGPALSMDRSPVTLKDEVVAGERVSVDAMRLVGVARALVLRFAAFLHARSALAVRAGARTALHQVVAFIGMAFRTVRLERVMLRKGVVEMNVFLSGDWLNVIHVAAPLVFTKMMQVVARRNGANPILIQDSVDGRGVAFVGCADVSVLHRLADPFDAGRHGHKLFDDLFYRSGLHGASSQG